MLHNINHVAESVKEKKIKETKLKSYPLHLQNKPIQLSKIENNVNLCLFGTIPDDLESCE